MAHQSVIDHALPELKTSKLTAKLQDENGVGLPVGQITALTLTLYDQKTGTVVNGRDKQSILGVNGGSVDGSGNLALELAPADMALVDAGLSMETHVALIEWTYTGGKKGAHEVVFRVDNLAKVP